MTHRLSNPVCVFKRRALLAAVLVLLAALTLIPGTVHAATSGCLGAPNVNVSATTVSFGNYDVMNTGATQGTGSITVNSSCGFGFGTVTVSYTIALNAGNRGSFTPRSMTSGTSVLQYNLYTTPTLATIWGDGTSGTQIVADKTSANCGFFGSCSGATTDTLYGNLPAMQNVAAGNYTDSITVTVTF